MMESIRRYRSSSFVTDLVITTTGNFSITFFGAASGIIAARLLDQIGRGELAAAAVWALLVQAAMQWGLGLSLTFFVKQNPKSAGSLLSASLILLGIQSCIIFIIGGVATELILPVYKPEIVVSTRLYLGTVPFTLLIMYIASLGQGLGRFRLFNVVRIIPSIMYLFVLIYALIFNIRDVPYIVSLILYIYIMVGLGALLWFSRNVQPLERTCSRQVWGLFTYGMKTHIGALSLALNGRLDQFIMSLLLPLDQLGIYAVAVAYSTFVLAVSRSFSVVMYPRLRETSQIQNMVSRTLKITLFITSVMAVLLVVLCPLLLPVLFGGRFQSAVVPAQILTIGTIVLGANSILADALHALGLALQRSLAELAGVVITIIGLMAILNFAGIIGAAFVSLLAYSTVLLVMYTFFRKLIYFNASH